MHVEGRFVSPSESVPSKTFRALSRACFCTVARVSVCRFENGQADTLVKHKAATTALAIVDPTMMCGSLADLRDMDLGSGFIS